MKEEKGKEYVSPDVIRKEVHCESNFAASGDKVIGSPINETWTDEDIDGGEFTTLG